MPRPTTQATPSAITAPATTRSPGRAICTRHPAAERRASTASPPRTGSDAWTSVYDAPNTIPRGEKTSSKRSSQNPTAFSTRSAATSARRCVRAPCARRGPRLVRTRLRWRTYRTSVRISVAAPSVSAQPWTSRQKGRLNTKKPRSRPKSGSTVPNATWFR